MRADTRNDALALGLDGLRERYGEERVREQLAALERHGDVIDEPRLWLETALAGNFRFMPLDRVERCACGSADSELLSRFVYWNLLGVRQCLTCGLVRVAPRLGPAAMSHVFNQKYFAISPPEYWGARRHPIFRDVLRLIRRFGCRRVFDVGAAYGHFAKWLTEQGIEAAGSDLSEKTVQWGREHLGIELHVGELRSLELPRGTMDCVVSLDTLYYVADPVAELSAMRDLIRPGGHVILRLRNGRDAVTLARREGKKPVGEVIMPGQHVWAFTPETIAVVLRKSGFRPVLVEPAAYSASLALPLHGLAVAANRLAVAAGLPVFTRSFNIVGENPKES